MSVIKLSFLRKRAKNMAALKNTAILKSDLITTISRQETYIPVCDVALCINTLFKTIRNHIANGGRVEIRDFGGFKLNFRPPRQAHNPQTGEKLVTSPKSAVHFKPGKGLKERVNKARNKTKINDDKQ